MSKKTRTRSLAKGALAGLIGGVVAVAAKHAAENIYPAQNPRKRIAGPELVTRESVEFETAPRALAKRTVAQQTMHWGISAATGAAYGAAVELYPGANAKLGASFGTALMALNQDRTLPALGLFATPAPETKREQTSQLVGFVVYGIVTETVRRVVRRMID